MTKDELIQFLKDNLRLEVKEVPDAYDVFTKTSISISIGDEKITEIQINMP